MGHLPGPENEGCLWGVGERPKRTGLGTQGVDDDPIS